MKGRGKQEILREDLPTSGIVRHDSRTCENTGVTRPGIEPGSLWWEASRLTAQPPRRCEWSGVKRLGRLVKRSVYGVEPQCKSRAVASTCTIPTRDNHLGLEAMVRPGTHGKLHMERHRATHMGTGRARHGARLKLARPGAGRFLVPGVPGEILLSSYQGGLDSRRGRPNFRMWETWRSWLMTGRFSLGTPVTATLAFHHCPIFTSTLPLWSSKPRCEVYFRSRGIDEVTFRPSDYDFKPRDALSYRRGTMRRWIGLKTGKERWTAHAHVQSSKVQCEARRAVARRARSDDEEESYAQCCQVF
ncbi:hypothetical protein PR048_017374 [Dryococelus australis]|uniref:Uncharacterized protein n=1 Tax=Dryococelus australis TaxID=614101 RepID=A0ABQ9H9H5_9NEOP|nr:hypothetical protein PR048_017374 [Dryococelus australis]